MARDIQRFTDCTIPGVARCWIEFRNRRRCVVDITPGWGERVLEVAGLAGWLEREVGICGFAFGWSEGGRWRTGATLCAWVFAGLGVA